MVQKVVVVDAKNHLMGRLASVVAKQLKSGQKVVVVRCEELHVSGSLYRNKLKFEAFLNLRFSTNPIRGHFHERSPSKIFRRCVRGMINYKTTAGSAALTLLECYEGVPEKYETKKKWSCHAAFHAVRMQAHRKFCVLKDLSKRVGWNYSEVVEKLEGQRKIRASQYYNQKKKSKKITCSSKS